MFSPRALLARMSFSPSTSATHMARIGASPVPQTSILRPTACSASQSKMVSPSSSSSFSTSAPTLARKSKMKVTDPRVKLIRYHLGHPKTPRPLRFSRMRALRHWTIHRAWMLLRNKQRKEHEAEMLRMYQSMEAACEELRKVQGPEDQAPGRLYRIAMLKRGLYQPGGIPIEYARAQTDTPATEAWNHGWSR